MSVRERILTIRLVEKLQERPLYAEALGIEITVAPSAEAVDKKEK